MAKKERKTDREKRIRRERERAGSFGKTKIS